MILKLSIPVLRGKIMVGSDYARGWEDCLDVLANIVHKTKSVDDIKEKIGYLQVLVKERKFEKIREQLGILGRFF